MLSNHAKTMTVLQLAAKHNYSRDHMYKELRKYNIQAFRIYPGRYWVKEDYRILHICAGKISTSGIGKLLGRTATAVESKCQVLGISYGRYRRCSNDIS